MIRFDRVLFVDGILMDVGCWMMRIFFARVFLFDDLNFFSLLLSECFEVENIFVLVRRFTRDPVDRILRG